MKTNRLISEQSPYLLQHAHNPVNWFPWCDEAFEKAKKENKPIFLSIGYSTCHWCHVMEKESFEDEEVAQLMNDAFVSIKVDREERPDVDGIYMTVCQMLTGSGGWPLTIVMTPDKKPFFAGTYFPKLSRYGRIGMVELIPKLKDVWETKRNEVIQSSEEIINSLINSSKFDGKEVLTDDVLHKAFSDLWQRYDSEKGGFGKSPKFPVPHVLTFLLRYWKKFNSIEALKMVEHTLFQMRIGGIYDQVGFGFHRYSTDRNWLVPHFEKMLYDQALLSIAYTEAYQAIKNNFYKKTTEEILEYVTRDMRYPEGGFYSAEDADSEGEEGKFYLWTIDEISELIGDDAKLFVDFFNLQQEGNWVDPMHGGKVGTNILHMDENTEKFSHKYGLSSERILTKISDARKKLFDNREKRIHPFKDNKILTDWNSIIISALAKASQVLGSNYYVSVMEAAINFILDKLVSKKGRLLHMYRNGNADIPGNLDDYSFFIAALIDAYETTLNVKYLDLALKFQSELNARFWDSELGGYFFTAHDGENLLIRQKEIYDGAIPSGNSIALMNLIRLHRLTGNSDLENKAEQIIRTFSKAVKLSPSMYTQFLSSLNFYLSAPKEILIVGDDVQQVEKYIRIIRDKYIPHKVICWKNSENEKLISTLLKHLSAYPIKDNEITIYLCENFVCSLPITSLEELSQALIES